jgi:hypothetical protein
MAPARFIACCVLAASTATALELNLVRDCGGVGDGATLNYEARMCGILPADHDWSASIKTKAPTTRFAF